MVLREAFSLFLVLVFQFALYRDIFCISFRGLRSNVANWFGVGDPTEEARQQTLNRWRLHVERMHANSSLLGGYKRRAETLDSVFEHSSAQPSPAVFPKTPQPYDPLARGHRFVIILNFLRAHHVFAMCSCVSKILRRRSVP